MRNKLLFLTGVGIGYVLGTKAGRERYEQINNWIDQARNSDAAQAAQQKAREIIDDADDVTANYSQN